MAPKAVDDTPTDQPATAPAEGEALVGAAAPGPLRRVTATVSVMGLAAQQTGTVADTEETRALIAAGYLVDE